jgi:hypothetical protein
MHNKDRWEEWRNAAVRDRQSLGVQFTYHNSRMVNLDASFRTAMVWQRAWTASSSERFQSFVVI